MTIDDVLLDVLRRSDAMQAKALADRTGIDIDRVYEGLIRAEALGKVRVVCVYGDKKSEPIRLWESMEVSRAVRVTKAERTWSRQEVTA